MVLGGRRRIYFLRGLGFVELTEERQGSRPLVLEKSSKHRKKAPKLGRSTAVVGSAERIWTVESFTSSKEQEERTRRRICTIRS
jgi:hypothetical protein